MKKLLLLLFVSSLSFGQNDGYELCYRFQSRSFTSNIEADKTLDKILSVIGASKRFVLMPCNNVPNALATNFKGFRYILYNEEFMKTVTDYTNNWSNLAILAHEVGHHINGHLLSQPSLEENRKMELESDEFAGFIMAKLGASLDQALSFTEILVEKDDTYETHPTKSKRVNAVKNGYNRAGGRTTNNNREVPEKYKSDNSTMSAEQYFNRAGEKFDKGILYGAIEDLTKAIELNPNIALAHKNRGLIKADLKDYYGAIADLSEAIDIDPNDVRDYLSLGVLKMYVNMDDSAISDFTKVIELDPNNAEAYQYRGIVRFNSKKTPHLGCSDWYKAASLGDEYSTDAVIKNRCDDLIKSSFSTSLNHKLSSLDPNDFPYVKKLLIDYEVELKKAFNQFKSKGLYYYADAENQRDEINALRSEELKEFEQNLNEFKNAIIKELNRKYYELLNPKK